MRATLIVSIVVLMTLTGCESMRPSVKADNPVVGPPPPRIANAGRDSSGGRDKLVARSVSTDVEEGEIRPVSRSYSEEIPFDDDLVVAKVNGSPIFARELLQLYRPHLHALHQQVEQLKGTSDYSAGRAQEKKIRGDLVRRSLPDAIDRRLLALAIRGSVKAEQFKQIQEAMEANYKEVERQRMKDPDIKAATPEEFRQKMRAQGYDPDEYKQFVNESFMSQVYMQLKGQKTPEPTRKELLDYYKQHQEDFHFPDQVKWQQIQVLSSVHGGKDQARAHLEQAVDELLDGTPFPDVARKYSDGITAEEGGQWDWMKRNALADKDLEKRLFNMPIGEVSPVIESENGFQVVVVVARREEGYKPLEDVQDEIAKAIKTQAHRKMIDDIIDGLHQDAVVWTIFDEEEKANSSEEPASLQPLTARG